MISIEDVARAYLGPLTPDVERKLVGMGVIAWGVALRRFCGLESADGKASSSMDPADGGRRVQR